MVFNLLTFIELAFNLISKYAARSNENSLTE